MTFRGCDIVIIILIISVSCLISLAAGYMLECMIKTPLKSRGVDFSLFGAFFGIMATFALYGLLDMISQPLSIIDSLALLLGGVIIGPALFSFLGQITAIQRNDETAQNIPA